MYDVIVAGAGPTGLAAGIQLALFGLNTLVLEAKEEAGGIAVRASSFENYPGFPDKISGKELMKRMTVQAVNSGVKLHTLEEVIDLSLRGRDKVVKTNRAAYSAKALILTCGSGMKGLGMKWETWFGGGVAYCLECGEQFFKGKDVIVVGSVREAVEETLRLTKIAAKVRLVNHANKIMINEQTRNMLKNKGIQIIEGFVGEEINGNPPSKTLILRSLEDGAIERLETNIIFVVAGVKPFVSVLRRAGIKTHRLGCVVVDKFGRTSIKGVFAAGGCASTIKDLVPPCVGDGATIAIQARLYVSYVLDS
jgi:thioredoxin reductase (NADPH)